MRKLPASSLAALGALVLAGTAFAATNQKTHVMDVALPDGSVAHVEYVGDVAPKVTIAPRDAADARGPWGMMFPSFAGFDRMIEQMQRQSQEMLRRAQEMSRHPAGAAPYIASYGNLPAGQTSTTIVSVSNNGQTCTRTTEIVSQGAGKAPKVTTNVSGQCSDAPLAAEPRTHPA
ncbi:MAG TPA: hypothetical protein VHE36_15025 [Sphingomicrobium sp.]|nr:hypothetical protein [Sphingomicrobium sp.]